MHIDFQFIVLVVTFAITIGTLIWRMAILHHQCVTNKDNIVRAHQRIDKLEDTQTQKIDALVKQIQTIERAQIRMEEKLNLLIKMEKEVRHRNDG